MTIKIEQEAIIRVLDTARLSLPCHTHSPLLPPSAESILLRKAAALPSPAPYVDSVLKPTHDDDDVAYCPDLLPLDSDDDCISLSSCSSASFCSGRSIERRVSFAEPLVTEVRTRPRTRNCDKRLLFYTQAETDRFRQLYREERQSLSSDNVQSDSPFKEPPSSETSVRRRISRVVVEHNDNLSTFYDFDDLNSYSLPKGGASMNDVFFDNDSFWSGSITWY